MTRRMLVALMGAVAARPQSSMPAVRAITRGPKFHWFGYYDKWQFDVTDRYILSNQVSWENRSPAPGDAIRVGMIDTADGDRWIDLGESRAWCWQQGCMLQWLPGSRSEVIWNDCESGQLVSHIVDVRTGKRRTVGAPVYAISPDGRWAVSPDFRRLHHLRPGYGYAPVPDPNRDVPAPEDAGIWRTDLRSGKTELIISFARMAGIPAAGQDTANSKHWLNHLLFSPAGDRFVFLHRWQGPQHRSFVTRMFTADRNGKDLYVLDPHGRTSHFIWRDADHVLAWAYHPMNRQDRFYLYRDKTQVVEPVGPSVMTVNGHCTYLPHTSNRWILNDTYPDKERLQHVYVFDTRTGRRVSIGDFLLPKEYAGEWRCDTHPRYSRSGRKVCIDSPHGGNGRQMYLIDIASVIA